VDHIQLEQKAPGCFTDNCPGDRYTVPALPGWRLVIGRKPETALGPEALAEIATILGPGEYAALVPASAL
jgi:hypothetical protein